MKIVMAAMRTKAGYPLQIICVAERHGQMDRAFMQMGIDPRQIEEGFIGDDRKFYSREEAAKIAWENKQIAKEVDSLNSDLLY